MCEGSRDHILTGVCELTVGLPLQIIGNVRGSPK